MPKYTFECGACKSTVQKFVAVDKKTAKCRCGNGMNRKMPKLSGHAQVTETVDKYTNRKWKQDQEDILEERKADYFWSVEVPRFVNSGTYSIETMLEMGWIYFNDKEEVQIRTKPPQKD